MQMHTDITAPHPESWSNVELKGIPKTRDTKNLAKLRWIARISIYRQCNINPVVDQ